MTATVASDEVRNLFTENRLPADVITYMVQNLNIDTIGRAQHAFDAAHLTRDVDALLVACGYHPVGTDAQRKEARRIAGDIKQFWNEAVAINGEKIIEKATGVKPEVFGPLPQFTSQKVQTGWTGRYQAHAETRRGISLHALALPSKELFIGSTALLICYEAMRTPYAQ